MATPIHYCNAITIASDPRARNMDLIELKYAVRRLVGTPRFSLAVILTVAIAVAPMLVAFSIFEATYLRGLAAKSPDRLLRITSVRGESGQRGPVIRGLSYPDLVDLRRDLNPSLWRYIAAWKVRDLTVETRGGERTLRVAVVAGDYFRLASARFFQGTPNDEDPESIVVTRTVWEQLPSSGDGRSIGLLGERLRVSAVVDDPFRGIFGDEGIDAWVSIAALPRLERSPDLLSFREVEDLTTLIEGASEEDLAALASAVTNAGLAVRDLHDGARFDWHLATAPARPSVRALVRSPQGQVAVAPLLVMLCILLIAASNVANLFAIRGAVRSVALRLRLALGATRRRLILVESIEPALLAFIGLALGVWVGVFALRAIAGTAVLARLSLAPGATSIVAALLAAVVFVALSVASRGSSIMRLLESDVMHAGHGITSRGVSRLQRTLLVLQFTLALAFTSVAIQLAAAVRQLARVNVGFDTENLLVVTGATGATGRTPDQWRGDLSRVSDAVREIRDVRGVAASVAQFFGGYGAPGRPLSLAQGAGDGVDALWASMEVISPGYFTTIGLPVISGREFAEFDVGGGPSRVMINQELARRVSGGRNPVGMTLFESGTYPLEVVGVVPNIRATAAEQAEPVYYRSLTQSPLPTFVLYVRCARLNPALQTAVANAITAALPESRGRLQLQAAESQRQERDRPARAMLWLAITLAAISMTITGLGLFGVASYAAQTRTREFGMRAAIGAPPSRLAGLVLVDGVLWTGAAAALSVPFGYVGMRVASTLVVGARPIPIQAQLVVIGAYVLVVGLALAAPAWRAANVDPADALRST